jgi:hypothetical protein
LAEVSCGAELAVAVVDQKPHPLEQSREAEVARLLGHPITARIRHAAPEMHAAGCELALALRDGARHHRHAVTWKRRLSTISRYRHVAWESPRFSLGQNRRDSIAARMPLALSDGLHAVLLLRLRRVAFCGICDTTRWAARSSPDEADCLPLV